MLRIAANFATRQAQTERAALEGMKEQVQAEQFEIQITCKTQEPQNLNDAKQPGVVTDGWNLKKSGQCCRAQGSGCASGCCTQTVNIKVCAPRCHLSGDVLVSHRREDQS